MSTLTMRPKQVRPTSQATDNLFDYADNHPVPERDDEFWNLKTIKAKTGLSRSTIYVYVARGQFPRQRKLGPRRIGWLASEVRAWIAGRPRSGT